jgi:hypothetical protein
MNAKTAWLHNPQSVNWRFLVEGIEQSSNQKPHCWKKQILPSHDHESWGSLGRKAQHIGEIEVEADQKAVFRFTECIESFVAYPLESLLLNSTGIMSSISE